MSDHPPVPPGALPGGAPPATYPSGPPLAPPPSPVPAGTLRPGAGWPTPPPPPEPPARGRKGWVVAAAIVAVLALFGATFAAFVDGDDDRDDVASDRRADDDEEEDAAPPATDESPVTPAPPTTVRQDFEAVVDDIQAFVERERGLTFQRDVTVELADDAAFEARLLEDFEEDAPELEMQGRVFEALGLVEPGTDLVEAYRTLIGAGVVGFYDPTTDELVVRGSSTSPYVRTVIAHELVHALDDQHFELDRPALDDATDESGFGFTGLVEGNARRIEDAYRATFTPAEEQEALAEELTIGADVDLFDVPPILVDLLIAPYQLGPPLVDDILDEGGQERLDAAFSLPPTTSEHLIVTDTYLAGETPVAIEVPQTDLGQPVIDEGVLGALGIAELLGVSPVLFPTALDPAVEGWGGDRYVAWNDIDGSGTCVRANIVGDTDRDTEELRLALVAWASAPPFAVAASVEGGTGGAPITLTSCSA